MVLLAPGMLLSSSDHACQGCVRDAADFAIFDANQCEMKIVTNSVNISELFELRFVERELVFQITAFCVRAIFEIYGNSVINLKCASGGFPFYLKCIYCCKMFVLGYLIESGTVVKVLVTYFHGCCFLVSVRRQKYSFWNQNWEVDVPATVEICSASIAS